MQAYVDGFVSEIAIYPGYSAGVYANAGPMQTDISQVTPPPSAVWVVKTPYAGNPPAVSTWGLSPLCDPYSKAFCTTLWTNHQRLHQFLTDQSGVTFGNATLKIDDDIDDGPVLVGLGNKTPLAFTYSNLTNQSWFQTAPTGINDMNNANFAFMNGNSQVGQIIGWTGGGSFLYAAGSGTFTLEPGYPGSFGSFMYGINNLGDGAAQWLDSNSIWHGFVFTNNSSSWLSFDPPGSTFTYPYSINDDRQVAGYYTDSAQNFHGFRYDSGNGNFAAINYPGATSTWATGINGSGQIVGYHLDQSTLTYHWFIYDSQKQSFTLFSSPNDNSTHVFGINNNGQVVGSYLSGGFFYDTNSGSLYNLFYQSGFNFANSINDFTEIVGQWNVSQYSGNGFYAAPQ